MVWGRFTRSERGMEVNGEQSVGNGGEGEMIVGRNMFCGRQWSGRG